MSILAAVAVPHPPILLPEVGHGEEEKIVQTAAAYREAMRRVAALKPDTVVVTSPHTVMYADYFHISPGKGASGDMGAFLAGDVKLTVQYDPQFAGELERLARNAGISAGTRGQRDAHLDHGTMIPLYFLNQVYGGYRVVRIGLSGLPPLTHYRFGQCIAAAAEGLGRRVVVLASGDLSHKLKADGPYGFAPEGPDFDRQVTAALGGGDFLPLLRMNPEFAQAAAECGLRSFQIMAGTLDRKAVMRELLSYEGPFGVGYGVACFEVTGEDPSRDFGDQWVREERETRNRCRAEEDAYVRLARQSIETYVKTGRAAALPEGLPEELLRRRAGVFVSLKEHGRLRGCIGTTSPTTGSVAEEIMQNAVSAAVRDPRFMPVVLDELEELVYSVDVLGKTEPIESPEQLDVKRYGVIVENGGRRGLLLPNLEGVDTVARQIAISKQKAGIAPDESVRLRRFEVVRHK